MEYSAPPTPTDADVKELEYQQRIFDSKPVNPMTSIQSDLRSNNPLIRQIHKMLRVVEDPQVQMHEHKIECRLCNGSGWAPLYTAGKRAMVRCPSWVWDADEKKGHCEGYLDWLLWQNGNREDLCKTVWKLGLELDLNEEQISAGCKKYYLVDWPEKLMIEQLEHLISRLNAKLNARFEDKPKRLRSLSAA